MKKYVIQRFIQLIPVLLGITFLSFAMMRIAGSDAITEMYGDKGAVAQEVIDAKRAELGLDKLPKGLREMAFTRANNPETPLGELGELMEPPLGKSGVSARLRRLSDIADKLRSGDEIKL